MPNTYWKIAIAVLLTALLLPSLLLIPAFILTAILTALFYASLAAVAIFACVATYKIARNWIRAAFDDNNQQPAPTFMHTTTRVLSEMLNSIDRTHTVQGIRRDIQAAYTIPDVRAFVDSIRESINYVSRAVFTFFANHQNMPGAAAPHEENLQPQPR